MATPNFNLIMNAKLQGNANTQLHKQSCVIAGQDRQKKKADVLMQEVEEQKNQKEQEYSAFVIAKSRTEVAKEHRKTLDAMHARFLQEITDCNESLVQKGAERKTLLNAALNDRRHTTRMDAKMEQLKELDQALKRYKKYIVQVIDLIEPHVEVLEKTADIYRKTPHYVIDRHMTLTRLRDENISDFEISEQKLQTQQHVLQNQKEENQNDILRLNEEIRQLRDTLQHLENTNLTTAVDIEKSLKLSSVTERSTYQVQLSIRSLYANTMRFKDLVPDDSLSLIQMLSTIELHYTNMRGVVNRIEEQDKADKRKDPLLKPPSPQASCVNQYNRDAETYKDLRKELHSVKNSSRESVKIYAGARMVNKANLTIKKDNRIADEAMKYIHEHKQIYKKLDTYCSTNKTNTNAKSAKINAVCFPTQPQRPSLEMEKIEKRKATKSLCPINEENACDVSRNSNAGKAPEITSLTRTFLDRNKLTTNASKPLSKQLSSFEGHSKKVPPSLKTKTFEGHSQKVPPSLKTKTFEVHSQKVPTSLKTKTFQCLPPISSKIKGHGQLQVQVQHQDVTKGQGQLKVEVKNPRRTL